MSFREMSGMPWLTIIVQPEGQPMNGQQFGAGYGQSSAYPAAPGSSL